MWWSTRDVVERLCDAVVLNTDGTHSPSRESPSPIALQDGPGGPPRGSLFRRDPDGTVLTVVPGLYFANGVTPTADGSALVFAETMGRRLSKYWLTGPQAGTVTTLAANLPGHPDNISTGTGGRIWVAIVSPVNAAAEWLAPRSPALRKLCGDCPTGCSPDQARGVGGRVRPRHGQGRRRPAHRAPVIRHGDRTRRSRRQAVDGLHRSAGRRLHGTVKSA